MKTGPARMLENHSDITKPGVLIVEGRHPPALLALPSILPASQYHLVQAKSHSEVLSRLKEQEFAAIILNQLSSEIESWQLLALLKTIDHDYHTPLIWLPAPAEDKTLPNGPIRSGEGIEHLVKARNEDELRAKLAVFAKQHCARRCLRRLCMPEAGKSFSIAPNAHTCQTITPQEEDLKTIIDSIPALVCYLDKDRCYRFANASYCTWFNVSPTQIVGMHLEEVVGTTNYNQLSPYLGLALSGQEAHFELSLQLAKHRNIFVKGSYIPDLNQEGIVSGMIGHMDDISSHKSTEQALRDRKSQLRLALEATALGTWDLDPRSGALKLSERSKELLGIPAHAAATYETFLASLHPDDADYVVKAIQRSLASEDNANYEVEYRCISLLDQQERWLRATGQAHFDKQGRAIRLIGTVIDITEHKRAVQSLLRHQEHLALTQEAGHIAGWEWDLEQRHYVYSGAVHDVYGPKPCQTFEEHRQAVHPDDHPKFIEAAEHSFIHGEFKLEYRLRWADGSYHWVGTSGRLLHSHNRGESPRIFGISVEITERKRAEEDLKRSEEKFRLLAEASPQTVWMADVFGRPTYFNERWFSYTGFSKEDTYTGKWIMAIHPDDRASTLEAWYKAVDEAKPYEREHRIRDRQGNYHWFLCRAIAVRGLDGQVLQWLGSTMDIDAQKRAQQQMQAARLIAEQANRAKSEFLANMSHEIRTPLNCIVGYTEFLLEPQLPPLEIQHFASTIRRNGLILSQLINDILDLSKVEAGKITIETMLFSLPDLLAEVKEMLATQAHEKRLAFSFHSLGPIPERITSDPTRLKQILLNIIGNAIKFTAAGRVQVIVTWQRPQQLDQSPTELCILVEDTGRGIAEEQQKHLFQPFCQADPTTTRKFGGTGLGLALSRKLAQVLGGDVLLHSSTLNQGSDFLIRINPGTTSGEIMLDPSLALPTISGDVTCLGGEPTHRLEGLRFLVAEDSPDNQFMIKRMLRREGAEVSMVQDGPEVIAKALAGDYEMILMDVQMPKIDGIEATKELRKRGYLRPIIALTANAMHEDRHKALEAGCTDHLPKPISRSALLDKIEQHIHPEATKPSN